MTDETVLESLVSDLQSEDESVRDDAVIRLLNAPLVATKPLVEALGQPDFEPSLIAALIANLRHTPAIFPLRQRLARTADPEARAVLERSIQYLESIASREKSFVGVARKWLTEIRPLIGQAVEERDAEQLRMIYDFAIATVAGETPLAPETKPPQLPFPQKVAPLLSLLGDADVRLRDRAEDALIRFGPPIAPTLRAAIASANPNQQVRIARLLCAFADLDSAPALIDLYGKLPEFHSTRMQVLETLGTLARSLANNPTELPLTDIIGFLAFARREMPLDDSEWLGQTLAVLARDSPCPELRLALPHLKGHWLLPTPHGLVEARLAIEEATKAWKDLPVPATVGETSASLPVPADGATWDGDALPKPTESRR